MIRPERAARVATQPLAARPLSRLLVATLAMLLAAVGLVVLPASPAGAADTVNQETDFTLACTAQTPLGPQAADFALTVFTEYETPVARGQTTQIKVSQPPLAIPTELEGFTVKRVTNVLARFRAPENFQVTGTSLTGGNYPQTPGWNTGGSGSVSYSAATNLVTLAIPGPIVPPVEVLPPTINIDAKAIGRVGTSGHLRFDSFQLEAVLVVDGLGDVFVSMNCPTPNPNPSLGHLTVASGSFVPQRQPVIQEVQAFGTCTGNVGGQGGFLQEGTNFRAHVFTPRFFMSSFKDVQPGETLQVEVGMQPLDCVKTINSNSPTMSTLLGGTTMSRPTLGIQNWRAEFEPPPGFSVQSVSTGDGMNATWDAARNRIRWARPTGAAGQFGGGGFSPPSLIVNLVANPTPGVTAPVTFTPLRFKGMGFSHTYEVWNNVLFLAPSKGGENTRNLNCSQGGVPSGNSTNLNWPTNPGGPAPSSSLPPSSGVPYHERIGWPNAITAWPAALNVGAYATTFPGTLNAYENSWANNAVIGTVGKATPPVANPDAPPVVANDGSSVLIDLAANDVAGSSPLDPVAELEIIDWPENGELEFLPDGSVRYTPDLAHPSRSDVFTYVIGDQEVGSSPCPALTNTNNQQCNQGQVTSRISNLTQVTLEIETTLCYVDDPRGPCSLSGFDGTWVARQIITAEVVGDVLTMEQDAGELTLFEELGDGTLRDLVLDGTPKAAVGMLNDLTVIDRRGEGGKWDVTGQVTDFKEDEATSDCPGSNPGTWDWRCIPGDNLGWDPAAVVNHMKVAGDVAVVTEGSVVTAPRTSAVPSPSLRAGAQQLCSAPTARAGGTFRCGADLELMTPASAAAQTYRATLTITLVG
jgi:dehydratase